MKTSNVPEKSAGQKSGRLEKFNLTATQAILYFDSIAPGGGFALKFRLRAKYPDSRAYFPVAGLRVLRSRS